MKTSKVIAADHFIRGCLERGITNHRDIIEEAREGKGAGSSTVEKLLKNGESIPYGDIETECCFSCGLDLMFDETNNEYYCPICEA